MKNKVPTVMYQKIQEALLAHDEPIQQIILKGLEFSERRGEASAKPESIARRLIREIEKIAKEN